MRTCYSSRATRSLASTGVGSGGRRLAPLDRVRSPLLQVGRRVLGALPWAPIGRLVRRLGLGGVLDGARERVLEVVVPDEVELTVDDLTLRFLVDNAFEFAQFDRVRTDPDRAVLAEFVGRVRPDDVLWDVGANVGVFSCFGAARGLRVVAVEPSPANVARIRENLDRNGFDARVVERALSDREGRSRLQTSIGPPGSSGAFGYISDADDADADVTTVSVPVSTASALATAEGLALPTVLKLDVEGEELRVLRGFGDALESCRLVYCNVYEKHFQTGDEGEAVRELLEGYGLTVTRIGEWDGGYFVRAERGDS